MYEQKIDSIRAERPKMAICYDFDKTLSPDDMQAFTLIPSFEIDKAVFWKESNDLAQNNLMDKNLAWMYELIRYSGFKEKSLRREYFKEIGSKVPLYKGVEAWFERINTYANRKNIDVEHYIISSGLKEIIVGSIIADKFKRIYASSYLYSTDGVAIWPAQAVNYTNKTQFIFRIAKGFFEEWDERVNDSVSDNQLYIPYENIVYIGDSATDIPCMRLVKSKGGYSIGVFDPEKDQRKNVYQLFNDGRINYYAPADYSAKSRLSTYVKQIIDEIASHEKIKQEQRVLGLNASAYKFYTETSKVLATMETLDVSMPSKEKKKLKTQLDEMRTLFEGNID